MRWLTVVAATAGFLAGMAGLARAAEPEARDMALLGHHDLAGRGAYQPVIHFQAGRWIAYVGHHGGGAVNPLTGRDEPNGTSVLDVSEPRSPRLLAHIPGAPGSGAQMARVCAGSALPRGDPARNYLLRTFGNSAHEVWDVTQPERPLRLAVVADGLRGTHKNWWECDTGIAYLVSGVPGWRSHRVTQIFDLADPARPVFIRNFGLPGQEPGASGPVPTGLHGAISLGPAANRLYFGHGTDSGGILQVVDRRRLLEGPRQPTPENLRHPQIARFDLPPDYGAHTAFPVGRSERQGADPRPGAAHLVVITNEALAEGCGGTRQGVWLVDLTDEARPAVLSRWLLDATRGGYCDRPGRVGAHSSHESFSPVYYGRIMFIAHFNAGVRAIDIRDPRRPVEIAHFVPRAAHAAVATNNVEVDGRGYVYIVDRHGLGLHVLELTGAARAAADLAQAAPQAGR